MVKLVMGKEGPEVIIGVGVVVENSDKKILMKKRKNSHGENEWALPGGKVDFGESFEEAGLRELKEETGLTGREPEKCQGFGWFSFDRLPENIFEGSEQVLGGIKGKGEKIRYVEKND